MKPFISITLLFIITVCGYAQDKCGTYFSFVEGTQLQYTYFDKKGKKTSHADWEIFLVEENDEGGLTAVTKMIFYDEKEGEVMDQEFDVSCDNNGITIDFESLMNPMMAHSGIGAELDVEGVDIILPNELKVGTELPDAEIKVTISSNGINLMSTTASTYNRKVAKKETVTTPAGTFECFKISYDMDVKTVLRMSQSGADWIAPGVGTVKSESYKKNGKLQGSTELTKFDKG